MWEGVICFLDIMLSCSNGILQWHWGLWLIGAVSLEVTPPWEIRNKLMHLKSGTENFLMVFFFLIASLKEKEVILFCTCFSVVWSTVKIPKFCVSICHTLRGPRDLALGGECSPFPSAVFTPIFLLCLTRHSCTFSLDTHQLHAMLKCLDEPELPGAAPSPVGTCWKTLFSRTVSTQLLDEFSSSCHGVNAVLCREAGEKDHCVTTAAHTYGKERSRKKISEGRKWRGYHLVTSETGVNHIASSEGHILLRARLVWSWW